MIVEELEVRIEHCKRCIACEEDKIRDRKKDISKCQDAIKHLQRQRNNIEEERHLMTNRFKRCLNSFSDDNLFSQQFSNGLNALLASKKILAVIDDLSEAIRKIDYEIQKNDDSIKESYSIITKYECEIEQLKQEINIAMSGVIK